jgi:hypothetical protein
MADIEEKRRIVRALLGMAGRGFAEECGFPVTNNPASLFQLLYLSALLSRRGPYQRAVESARALQDRGWRSAREMATSLHAERVAVLRGAGRRRDAEDLATLLGDLAQVVVDRYGGDLRRLRTQARRNPVRERELLQELPGVDGPVVDLFFREVQILWPEVAPFADRRALAAARKLHLGRTAQDLFALAGDGESEKLAWLVGALARTDLDDAYDKVRELATS